eukprot:m.141302 g.141302  ORF g.141302 m.141302 type:complete len:63 (+) comp14036_c0_seq1:74-262(+)
MLVKCIEVLTPLHLCALDMSVAVGTMIHVRNAPSPAATSALIIAEEIVDMAQANFNLCKPSK